MCVSVRVNVGIHYLGLYIPCRGLKDSSGENWVQISGEAEVSESEEERGFESFSRDFE